MKNTQNILFFIVLALAMVTVQTQIDAQDTQTDKKPSLVVFVVGMDNQVGDFLAILIGNELSGGGRYEIITRTDAVQKKLRELREYEQSGNVNEGELIEWGRQNNVSMLCLVTSIKLDEHMFAAQLTDVKSNKLVGSGDYSSANLGSAELKKAAESLATQLHGKGGGSSQNRGVSGSSGGKKNGNAYNPDGIDLVYVEGTGGTLGMQGFYIGKYEITQVQYQKVMGGNPSSNKAPNNPVENVSWNDAQEFLSKLNAMTGRNYRLPTEEEWVYAANGGLKNDIYEYAGSNNIHDVAWFTDNSGNRTHPVGTKSPNSIGIYDMSGNVYEWCQDYYDSSGSARVGRGGGYGINAYYCRVANRTDVTPDEYSDNLGFRVVLP
jgi:formylglycine-generating enzyme required for sulfatase activity